jgi:hypothetical protein
LQPSDRQFALAQYAIGIVHSQTRQLWEVTSGDGKSIITGWTAVIALLTGVFKKVHIVSENGTLL